MASFPSVPLPVKSELFIDGAWSDFTTDVRGSADIRIRRGRSDERSDVGYGRCNLAINNRNGTYSNRNAESSLYGKIGLNTQFRQAVKLITETFGGTTSSGWGSATSAADGSSLAWTVSGGAASDYSEGSGVGSVSLGSVNVIREAYLAGVSRKDCTVRVKVKPGAVALTQSISQAIALRRVDANNYYYAIASFSTSGTVTLLIAKRVAGVNTGIGAGASTLDDNTSMSYTASSSFYLEFTAEGPILSARIWNADPVAFTGVMHCSGYDTTFTAAGPVGARSVLTTGNTNALPVVVTYDDFLVDDVRFVGEVPEWPQEWDKTGTDFWVPIQAAGILRRLNQGTEALDSVITRTVKRGDQTNILAYWPCEDGSRSTSLASGTTNNPYVLVPSGSVSFSAFDEIGGTDPILTMGPDSGLEGAIAFATNTGSLGFRCLMAVPAAGLSDGAVLVSLHQTGSSSTVDRWDIVYGTASGGSLNFRAVNSLGTVVDSTGLQGFVINGTAFELYFEVVQNGSDVNTEFGVRLLSGDSPYVIGSSLFHNDTFPGLTVGSANRVVLGPAGTLNGASGGQVLITNDADLDYGDDPRVLTGWNGEVVTDRLERLCLEEGIPLIIAGSSEATMGPQGSEKFMDLLQECVEVDRGVLYESRSDLSLTYRCIETLYNQSANQLDVSAYHLSGVPKSTDDDQYVWNYVVVNRKNGSSHTAIQESGPLNVNDPRTDRNGVGKYNRSPVEVNTELDTQVSDIATWIRGGGTVDEVRYPSVEVNLARSPFVASASLTESVSNRNTGDVLSLANLPNQVGGQNDAYMMIQGYDERISNSNSSRGWEFTFNTTPSSPFNILQLDTAGYDRGDTVSSELVAALNSSDTSFDVATLNVASASDPRWTQAAGDFNFDISVDGEVITVTAITGAEVDAFGRTSVDTWGSADVGGAWTNSGGASTDYDVAAGLGTHSHSATNASHTSVLAGTYTDADVYASVRIPTAAATQGIHGAILARYTDASNYYYFSARFDTGNVLTAAIVRRLAGVESTLASATAVSSYSTATLYRIRMQVTGTTLRMKVWLASSTEPAGWQVVTTDSNFTSGKFGLFSRLITGNTNTTPYVVSFDNYEMAGPQKFTVTRSTNGVTKSHSAGDSVSLAKPVYLGLWGD